MNRNIIYHYRNSVTVQCNPDPLIIARSPPMYEQNLRICKGVDNTVQFLFKNSDQKPVNCTGWVITFNMFSDAEGQLAVSKVATIVDAVKGIVTVSLNEFDLMGLSESAYKYALTVTDPTGSEQVVYTDESYRVRGDILIEDGPYPILKPSIVVDLPTSSNTSIITSGVTSTTRSRQLAAHHSAQFYFTNFTGTITIQATLDILAPGNSNLSWATVKVLNYTNQIDTDFCEFDGVFSAVRFVIAPTDLVVTPSPVTKILYRV